MVISEALRRSPGKVVPVVPPSFFFSCFGGSVFFELFWGVKKPFADSIQYSISLENGPFKDFCSWHWIAIRHFLGRDRCGCSNTCLECWNQCMFWVVQGFTILGPRPNTESQEIANWGWRVFPEQDFTTQPIGWSWIFELILGDLSVANLCIWSTNLYYMQFLWI